MLLINTTEYEILKMVYEGYTYKDIASKRYCGGNHDPVADQPYSKEIQEAYEGCGGSVKGTEYFDES